MYSHQGCQVVGPRPPQPLARLANAVVLSPRARGESRARQVENPWTRNEF